MSRTYPSKPGRMRVYPSILKNSAGKPCKQWLFGANFVTGQGRFCRRFRCLFRLSSRWPFNRQVSEQYAWLVFGM